jgi:hypothetical protein
VQFATNHRRAQAARTLELRHEISDPRKCWRIEEILLTFALFL